MATWLPFYLNRSCAPYACSVIRGPQSQRWQGMAGRRGRKTEDEQPGARKVPHPLCGVKTLPMPPQLLPLLQTKLPVVTGAPGILDQDRTAPNPIVSPVFLFSRPTLIEIHATSSYWCTGSLTQDSRSSGWPGTSDPPASMSRGFGITGMHHHAPFYSTGGATQDFMCAGRALCQLRHTPRSSLSTFHVSSFS